MLFDLQVASFGVLCDTGHRNIVAWNELLHQIHAYFDMSLGVCCFYQVLWMSHWLMVSGWSAEVQAWKAAPSRRWP